MPRDFRREIAWDIEATEWSNVILVCGITSDGDRWHAPTLREFFREAEKRGYCAGDTRWWAHWGGIYDHLLLVQWALASGWYLVDGRTVSGGAFWSLDLGKGKRRIIARDSARILPESLAKIGRAYGLQKLEVDRANLSAEDHARVLEYCYRDCEIVLLALSRFREFVEREGGVLRDTLASCTATLLRARAIPEDAWGWDADTDAVAAPAYAGGRVERFVSEAGPGWVSDICSAYPAAMSQPLPTVYAGTGSASEPCRSPYAVITARVKVPKTAHVGPLFYRPRAGALRGRLVFPTGEWRGTYTREELETAAELGLCDYTVEHWHGWDASPWLEPFMQRWYERRAASTDEAERYTLKILLNSVSGKLIERGEYETLTQSKTRALDAEGKGATLRVYPVRAGRKRFELYSLGETRLGPLRHAAAAAHVTARTRSTLLRAMCRASRVDYCDTDAINGQLDDASATKTLGAWNRELDFSRAEYLGPKMYALFAADGTISKLKAKGFHTGDDPAKLWESLRTGAPLSREVTILFRTQIRHGEIAFQRDTTSRQRRANVDKRCFSGINSRPWTVKELEALPKP